MPSGLPSERPEPKSGWTEPSRPIARTIASDPGRTGAPSMRWFHGLVDGKIGHPAIAAAAGEASMTRILAPPMRLLVTGGAGYIGSIVAQQLIARGDDVVVLDSLYKGHRAAVPPGAAFVEADLLDHAALAAVFASERFDGVLHFAALS